MIVSCVGAVQPLETVTPRSGAVLKNARLSCSDSEASDDDVLSVGTVRPLETAAPLGGARVPINRPMIYYTRLNDFDWVVPHYDTDILLSGRDIEVEVTDLIQDIRVLPDVFPVIFDETVAVPMTLPVVVETGPQVDYDPDILLSGRDIEVGITDITQDIRDLPDAFPVLFDETAAVPLSSPVVVETGPQVDIPAVVPLVDEMTLCVATVGLSNDASDRPSELLNSESDGCFVDESMLVLEMSPVVSARGTAVPTISEVFSSAVLAGGLLLRQPPWPW